MRSILHETIWCPPFAVRVCALVGIFLTHIALCPAAPPQVPLPPPLYSFDLTSPAMADGCVYDVKVDVNADDVLALNGPCPLPVITGAALGLGVVGDELDGLSSANPLILQDAPFVLLFSVSRDTQGTALPDPGLIALGIPYNVVDQADRGQQAGDEFMSTLWFTRSGASGGAPPDNNVMVRNNYDEGGTDLAARPETSAKSVVIDQPQDNVDALADVGAAAGPYFSAGFLPPSHALLPGSTYHSGAHIFHYDPLLSQITLFASRDDLGLQAGDDVDAMVVFDRGIIGDFDGADQVLFSLTPDSPSLGTIVGASVSGAAADIFLAAPAQAPSLFASAASLGLGHVDDDIDALDIQPCTNPTMCAIEHGIRSTPVIPAISEWGALVVAILLLIAGTILISNRRLGRVEGVL